MDRKEKSISDTVSYVQDIRDALNKGVGDDDLASLMENVITDLKQVIRVLTREGFADENEFKTLIEE